MTKKIFYSFYILTMIVGIVFVSAELMGIALPLINMASTGAVALGSLILLWLAMLNLLAAYATVKFIKKYILN
jgi:hypothetical protein